MLEILGRCDGWFSSHRTAWESRLEAHCALSSVVAPFSDRAAQRRLYCWVFHLRGHQPAVLLPRDKPWDMVKALLLSFSGLIGKTLDVSGNSRFLAWHTAWLFLAGFISMTYTNILQSIVVVPDIRFNGPTWEEMIARNFTFESITDDSLRAQLSTKSSFIVGSDTLHAVRVGQIQTACTQKNGDHVLERLFPHLAEPRPFTIQYEHCGYRCCGRKTFP